MYFAFCVCAFFFPRKGKRNWNCRHKLRGFGRTIRGCKKSLKALLPSSRSSQSGSLTPSIWTEPSQKTVKVNRLPEDQTDMGETFTSMCDRFENCPFTIQHNLIFTLAFLFTSVAAWLKVRKIQFFSPFLWWLVHSRSLGASLEAPTEVTSNWLWCQPLPSRLFHSCPSCVLLYNWQPDIQFLSFGQC